MKSPRERINFVSHSNTAYSFKKLCKQSVNLHIYIKTNYGIQLVPASPAVPSMAGSSALDSFRDERQVAV